MAKGKKKNTLTIVLLLVLVVAMGAAYFLLSKKGDSEGSTDATDAADDKSVELSEIANDQIAELTFDNGRLSMTLIYEGEGWLNKEDSDFPVNQSKANALRNAISGLTATQTVTEAPEDLSQFGLTEPSLTASLTLTDNTTFSVKLGDKLATGEGYYAMVNEDPAVYVVNTSVYNMYNIEMSALIESEGTPSLTTDQITEIRVLTRDNGNFEARYDPDNEYDFSENGMYPWTIFQPYATPVYGDSTNIGTLLENYTSFSLSKCVDYNAEDLSKYGLDDPSAVISLTYTETPEEESDGTEGADSTDGTDDAAEAEPIIKEYSMFFGNTDENGNYYVRQDGSNAVYTMSKSTAETKITVNAFEQVSKLPALIYINNCTGIDIDIEGEKYQSVIEHTTVKDDDGNETVEDTFYYQGVEATNDSDFRSFYQELIGFKFDTVLTGEVDGNAAPFMTITFHKNTEERNELKIEFLPYDENFYAVRVNGIAYFGSDARNIRALAETVKTYDPAAVDEE